MESKFLKQIPFFSHLSEEQLGFLASLFENRLFHKGDAVIMQNEVGDGMYVIIFGEVEVVRDGQVLTTLTTNDFFGEMALVADEPRSANVTVTSDDLSAFYLSRKAFKAIKDDLGDEVKLEILRRISEDYGDEK